MINSLFSLKIVQCYEFMKAIFAGMTELHLKHHHTSRLKFVRETIQEQLHLQLSQDMLSEQRKPGILPAGPDRLARKIIYEHG